MDSNRYNDLSIKLDLGNLVLVCNVAKVISDL